MSDRQPEADVHAAGLGLMLFSPRAFAEVPDGADFMAELGPEPKGRLYDQLVLTQRVVLLGIGSPEIYYRVRVVLQPETAAVDAPLGAVEFGLWIEGGVLAIRDGYEPMHWSVQDPYEVRFPVSDGYYRVRALWMPRPDGSDAEMHIWLVMERASERIPGDGWPVLMYDRSLRDTSCPRWPTIIWLIDLLGAAAQ
jgi:hypothetical protein